jgi:predicted RNase H-like HicB family nuclease
MEIIPLRRMRWSEQRDEYEEEDGEYGYEVRDNSGKSLAFGETREEALNQASAKILLPKKMLV